MVAGAGEVERAVARREGRGAALVTCAHGRTMVRKIENILIGMFWAGLSRI
jgi:hypothetical protein